MKTFLLFLLLAVGGQATAQTDESDTTLNNTLLEAKQYLSGVGRPKNQALALQLYLQCAQKGSAKAMNALGVMYNEGVAITRNRSTAIRWFTKAGQKDYASAFYNLGLLHKDATDGTQNFPAAFACFEKAATLGDEQSRYAQAYMLYKGLGVQQNYQKAAELFATSKGKPNSMYFLGLCYRNGYGVHRNVDTARYWLAQAAAQGYLMAMEELQANEAENSNETAQQLAATLKPIKSETGGINQYRKVEHSIPANMIEGKYTGHIVRYDWSGQYAINSASLVLDMKYKDGELTGTWTEADTITAPITARLTSTALIFQNTGYSKKDHYNLITPAQYRFDTADLAWSQKDAAVNIAGTIRMFSMSRNEPEKPLFISLTRTAGNSSNDALIAFADTDKSGIRLSGGLGVYPNPFSNVLTVEFELKERSNVYTKLLTLDGKTVYENKAAILPPGHYVLPIRPAQPIAPGIYLLELGYGSQTRLVKVVKY